jgi:transcription antitermination factor NusG
MNKTWHLFRFRQAAEAKVIRACRTQGWDPVAPKILEHKKVGKNRLKKARLVPAFYGYLVIGFEGRAPFREVCDMHASLKVVVGMDGRPYRIPDAHVQAVLNNTRFRFPDAEKLLKAAEPDMSYDKGDLVALTGAGFDGLQANVVEVDHIRRRAKVILAGEKESMGFLHGFQVDVPVDCAYKVEVDLETEAA